MRENDALRDIHRRTRVLTLEHKNEILSLLEAGWTQSKVAKLYGVSQPRISQFLREVRYYENNS